MVKTTNQYKDKYVQVLEGHHGDPQPNTTQMCMLKLQYDQTDPKLKVSDRIIPT